MARKPPSQQKPEPEITPEQADKIIKANLANLVKKVSQGSTLSGQQLQQLQLIAEGSQTAASNQVELARLLNVNRKTIQRWLKQPGNPGSKSNGKYPLREWREFARLHGHESPDDDDSPNQTQLKAKQILLQNEKLEFELKVLRKEYRACSEIEAWGGELGAAIRKVVTQLRKLAPQLAGLTVPEIEARLRESEADIMAQLHGLDSKLEQMRREIVK